MEGLGRGGKKDHSADDMICLQCITDRKLREIINSEGSKKTCCICGKRNIGITIKKLAEIIDPVFRAHFAPGEFERVYGDGDGDSYWEERQGEDLSYVLQELLGQHLDCENALIGSLVYIDPYDPQDGDEPFYDCELNYVETPINSTDHYVEWEGIIHELRNHRRFFCDNAREFFDLLFEGLEDLWFYVKTKEIDSSGTEKKDEPVRQCVVHEWPAGTIIYRSRRAGSSEDYNRIMLNPHVELAPPSANYARAGRMNPDGVSMFYGALEERTCLAEMRSSIGEHIVVGRFATTKTLRMLDFFGLERAFTKGEGLSYFQSDFNSKITKWKFLRQLHRLISQPIVPGHEAEYLITQALAEYLSHIRIPSVDGVLFGSTQHEGGRNVVLFPKRFSAEEDIETRFAVRTVQDSVELYQTCKIEYDIPKLDFHIRDGKVCIHKNFDDHEH